MDNRKKSKKAIMFAPSLRFTRFYGVYSILRKQVRIFLSPNQKTKRVIPSYRKPLTTSPPPPQKKKKAKGSLTFIEKLLKISHGM